jgi:hypothetical protein
VVVGEIDHPGLDERLFLENRVLDPGAGLSQRLRDLPRLPSLSIKELPHGLLHLVVAQRLGLADQQHHVLRQFVPFLDYSGEGVGDVIQVNEGLSPANVAGIDMAYQLALVDARDLLAEKGRVAQIVVDAGEPSDRDGNVAVLLTDKRLGLDLRQWIWPARVEWRIFADSLARVRGRVHEHRARKNELLDLERPQLLQ